MIGRHISKTACLFNPFCWHSHWDHFSHTFIYLPYFLGSIFPRSLTWMDRLIVEFCSSVVQSTENRHQAGSSKSAPVEKTRYNTSIPNSVKSIWFLMRSNLDGLKHRSASRRESEPKKRQILFNKKATTSFSYENPRRGRHEVRRTTSEFDAMKIKDHPYFPIHVHYWINKHPRAFITNSSLDLLRNHLIWWSGSFARNVFLIFFYSIFLMVLT